MPRRATNDAGLCITELPDGQGWHLCGDLDLECGERLWTVLRAAAAHDTRNPDDTSAWADARQAGATEAEDVWGPLGQALQNDGMLPHGLPRGRRKRLHDALSNALERYLAAGLGGLVSKTPVQIHVTIPEATITGTGPPNADPVPHHHARTADDSYPAPWSAGGGATATSPPPS